MPSMNAGVAVYLMSASAKHFHQWSLQHRKYLTNDVAQSQLMPSTETAKLTARTSLFEDIEVFDSRERRHSALSDVSPLAFGQAA